MKLTLRIALALALVAGFVGALAATGSYISIVHQVKRNVDDSLEARAATLTDGNGHERPNADPDDALPNHRENESCPAYGALLSIAAAQLVAPDGAITPCLLSGVQLRADADVLAQARASGRKILQTQQLDPTGDRLRVVTFVWHDGTVLQIARDLDEAEGALHGLRNRLIEVTLGGVALAALAGWLIARRIVRPVTNLRDAAESIARTQDLTTPIPGSRSADEVGSLSQSFTTMVDALATSRRQQQRLIADASHEMRTPLTSLRTNIELLEHFDRLGPIDRKDTLEAVQVDVGELTYLLTELVELATDRASSEEPVEPVELGDLVTDVISRASRRSSREITVVSEGEARSIDGRPRMLERAISNLVDNAVKYSPSGTPIEVALAGGRVEVRDRGPGIPEADLPHVFERFYRATEARSAAGTGLGLAIVEQIVERHGGRAWATNRPGGGAAVGFEVPVGPAAVPAAG